RRGRAAKKPQVPGCRCQPADRVGIPDVPALVSGKRKGRLASPFLVIAGQSTATAQCFNAVFQRRVAHEQASKAVLEAAVDAERGQAVRHLHRNALFRAQTLQCADHCARTGQAGAGIVGTVFALAREPHDDGAGQEAQYDLGEDGRDVVSDALAFFVLENDFVDEVADDPGEEHHKGVHHALHQRQRDHVTVGDVADFVGQHGFHFIRGKAFQQALADRDQRVVLVPARGEGVGLVR
nr:hypothetical protein [Tanacetum cinerariifolium]